MSAIKRICFAIPTLAAGGTERQLLHLMRGLAPEFEITVVCTGVEGPLASEARGLGAQVLALEAGSGWNPMLRPRIRRIFRAHRPDVLHAFLFGFDYPAVRAARETGVPVVVSGRRQLAHWKKPRHIRLQRRANRYVDHIIANSKAVADFASEQEALDRARYSVIYNGIDADAFASKVETNQVRKRLGIPLDRRIVGIVANFSPVKDHALFLEIAGKLMRERTDLHFLMVGGGLLHKEIMRAVRHRGWADRFTRHVAGDDLAEIYAIMSAMVLCSKSEGLPNAVIEALAARRPVIAAAVGGIPELIDNEKTGFLIDSRDPSAYAKAIGRVLSDPEIANAIGRRARENVRERFSLATMIDAHRERYVSLLARGNAWNG